MCSSLHHRIESEGQYKVVGVDLPGAEDEPARRSGSAIAAGYDRPANVKLRSVWVFRIDRSSEVIAPHLCCREIDGGAIGDNHHRAADRYARLRRVAQIAAVAECVGIRTGI